jgi:hypothetical protein
MTYPAFQKIPRLNRDVVISEKIDGTNGLIEISRFPIMPGPKFSSDPVKPVATVGELNVFAGSRNRWLSTGQDNFGFAKWVQSNAEALAQTLGEGLHYGEWWGQGIQRNYGLAGKRFSLFNTHRWKGVDLSAVPQLNVVPELYTGPLHVNGMEWTVAEDVLYDLEETGSKAAPGFMKPEGVIIYHTAAKQYFKATIEGDEGHKG